METAGLRARKKGRTRQLIVETAARLFAERGYEQVSVNDVARAAEVAPQTLYNYFPTKEDLVTDRDPIFREELSQLIRTRAPGVSPIAAIRPFALSFVEEIRKMPPEVWRGELPHLAVLSPTVHRLALDLMDRIGDSLGAAIAESSSLPREVAQLQGMALAGALRMMLRESGQHAREGWSQAKIANALQRSVERLFDELDRRFAVSKAAKATQSATRPLKARK